MAAKGFQSIAGFKKATVWGTPVVCGALDGIVYDSIGGKANRDVIPDISMGAGRRTPFPGFAGNYKLAPTIAMDLRYGGYNVKRLIAGILGTAGVPARSTPLAARCSANRPKVSAAAGCPFIRSLMASGANFSPN